MSDFRGRLYFRHRAGLIKALAHFPGALQFFGLALQIAAGHVKAHRVAKDMLQRLRHGNVASALTDANDQFDFMVQVGRPDRKRQRRMIGSHGIRRLGKEKRRLAIGIMAHLAGVIGVVAPDAPDATYREHGITAGNGNGGLSWRINNVFLRAHESSQSAKAWMIARFGQWAHLRNWPDWRPWPPTIQIPNRLVLTTRFKMNTRLVCHSERSAEPAVNSYRKADSSPYGFGMTNLFATGS